MQHFGNAVYSLNSNWGYKRMVNSQSMNELGKSHGMFLKQWGKMGSHGMFLKQWGKMGSGLMRLLFGLHALEQDLREALVSLVL